MMSEPDFITSARIAILGLGLMGGSLAMALRGKCAELFGIDTDPGTLSIARKKKIVNQVAADPGELLLQADLIILATPVNTILSLLEELPAFHPGSAVVLDLGSTKTQILKAMEALPERFDPVGGHPMCGKERSSLANAKADLFQGAPFAFTPLSRTSPRAKALVEQLANTIGAVPLWLDPETHDRWTAATSHLPYLIANALASATPLEARPLVGTGFRSTSRLAVSPQQIMLDILITNRLNVLAGIERFREQLETIEACLKEGDFDSLRAHLSQGAASYDELTGRKGV